jgi:hypothetical protein
MSKLQPDVKNNSVAVAIALKTHLNLGNLSF